MMWYYIQWMDRDDEDNITINEGWWWHGQSSMVCKRNGGQTSIQTNWLQQWPLQVQVHPDPPPSRVQYSKSTSKYSTVLQVNLQVQYSAPSPPPSTAMSTSTLEGSSTVAGSPSPSTSRSTSALSALMVTIIPLGQSLFRFIFQLSFYHVGFNGHNDHNDEKVASVSLDIISDLSLSIDGLNDHR